MNEYRKTEETAGGIPDWRESVRDTIIQEIESGCSEEEAARRSGIHPQTHWRWRQAEVPYDARINAARAEAVRRIKATVLAGMREGLTFGQSSKTAGREPGTVRAWRQKDAAFNAKVRRLIKKQRKQRARAARKRSVKKTTKKTGNRKQGKR